MADAPDLDLLAAALRADGRDLEASVEVLASKLEEALPDLVSVERKGGLLGGRKRVRRVLLELGEHRYELEAHGARLTCRRRSVVRGIVLKTEEHDLESWIQHGGPPPGARPRARPSSSRDPPRRGTTRASARSDG